jgi:methylthioribose-1-phosphate isomerase
MAEAIECLAVRGAPALGIAAAMGLGLAALRSRSGNEVQLLAEMERAADLIRSTRPTAKNLFWALERTLNAGRSAVGREAVVDAIIAEALEIAREDEEMCRLIGEYGALLVPDGAVILTHCNAGALATGGYGTALGVIRSAFSQGKRIHVFVDETRPLLQGARLTSWELKEEGISYTLITDSMAGWMMKQGRIDLVVVGADRIAANGDVANKIGTYTLGVLALENMVPFYVAAPYSTIDMSICSGEDIVIEERSPEEVTMFAGIQVAPEGTIAANPAFDVTPSRMVTAFITDRGVIWPPYEESLVNFGMPHK